MIKYLQKKYVVLCLQDEKEEENLFTDCNAEQRDEQGKTLYAGSLREDSLIMTNCQWCKTSSLITVQYQYVGGEEEKFDRI